MLFTWKSFYSVCFEGKWSAFIFRSRDLSAKETQNSTLLQILSTPTVNSQCILYSEEVFFQFRFIVDIKLLMGSNFKIWFHADDCIFRRICKVSVKQGRFLILSEYIGSYIVFSSFNTEIMIFLSPNVLFQILRFKWYAIPVNKSVVIIYTFCSFDFIKYTCRCSFFIVRYIVFVLCAA